MWFNLFFLELFYVVVNFGLFFVLVKWAEREIFLRDEIFLRGIIL